MPESTSERNLLSWRDTYGPYISWTGGEPEWEAKGTKVVWGPAIVKFCVTKTGARFSAWRRRSRRAKAIQRQWHRLTGYHDRRLPNGGRIGICSCDWRRHGN